MIKPSLINLAKHVKIFIFATFVVTVLWSLKTNAATKEIVRLKQYEMVFESRDSLLVKSLIHQLEDGLERIDTFFSRPPSSSIMIIFTHSQDEYQKNVKSSVPRWSQAVANLKQRVIVIRLANADEIKHAPQVLLHELVHLHLADRRGVKNIPGWFHEGLADFLSGDRLDLQEKLLIANALSAKKLIELSALDSLLSFHRSQANLGYAEAVSAIDFFVQRHGYEALKQMVAAMDSLRDMDAVFIQVTGSDFIDFEIGWYEYLGKYYRWLIFLNLEDMIFILMAILAILSILIVRYKNRKKLKEWDKLQEPEI